MGHRVDFEGPQWIGQVKSVRVLALKQLETLALEMERLAFQQGKLGAVIVKRSAGQGVPTPHLVIVTESVWKELCGRMPQDDAIGRCHAENSHPQT